MDDTSVPEYDDSEATPTNLMTAGLTEKVAYHTQGVYIEAFSRRQYRIFVEVNKSWRAKDAAKLKFVVNIDGQVVAEVFWERPQWIKATKFGSENYWSYTFEGAEQYERTKKFIAPFAFKDLQISKYCASFQGNKVGCS